LKTAFGLLAFGADQAYEENNITTDIGIMLRHFWTRANQEAAKQATANGNQAVGKAKGIGSQAGEETGEG